MEEDLVAMIAREMRAEGKLEYDARWERERRFNVQLGYVSSDAAADRLRWVESLSDSDISRMSAELIINRAHDSIQKTMDTLLEKGYIGLPGSHTLDGLDLADGVMHRLADRKGREAFREVFNSEFWSRPQGDLTLKDDLEILDPELREPNFGKPTRKNPGVV